jgi:hypothetical protein
MSIEINWQKNWYRRATIFAGDHSYISVPERNSRKKINKDILFF